MTIEGHGIFEGLNRTRGIQRTGGEGLHSRAESAAALQAQLQAIESLHKLGMLSACESCLPQILEKVLDAAMALTGADLSYIQLLDLVAGDLNIAVQRGFPEGWAESWNTVSNGDGICCPILKSGRRVVVVDVRQSPVLAGTPALDLLLAAGVHALQITPLVTRSGMKLGMFSTLCRRPHRPDARTLSLLDLLARQAADLIERTQSETAFQQSEARLRLAARAARVGLWDWDLRTNEVFFSPEWKRQIGYRNQEIPNRFAEWQSRVHPDDLQPTMEKIQAYLANPRGRHEVEFRFRHKDGSYRWICTQADVLRDRNGKPIRMLGCHIDITERKQAEAALQASRAKLQAALNSMTDAVFISDAQGNLVDLNQAFAAFHKFRNKEEFAKRVADYPKILDVFMDDGKPATLEQWAVPRALRGETGENVEYSLRRKDTGERWVGSFNFAPIRDPQDKIVGAVVVGRDITSRKEAELARARLAAIVESSSDAISAMDLNGVITDWTQSAERLYGYSAAEAVGKPITLIIPPDRQDEVSLQIEKIKRGERITSFETVRVGKGGRRIPVSLSVSPVLDGAGRIVGSSAISRDISDRKRLEAQLLEVGEREQHRIGHDLHDGLCQELHGLGFVAKLLERELRKELPARAPEARRLGKVLEHALRVTRSVARGLQPVNCVPEGLIMSLGELAGRTRDLYRVDCRFECRSRVLIQRHTAATHLYRIAQEAVNNAIKHARPTRIRIRLAATPQGILLGVRDNGIGIRRRERGGGGMGLHIMQYRAEAIHGTLIVQRHPAGGTEVVCTVANQDLLPAEGENHENNAGH